MIQQVMLSFLFICISTKVSIVKKELALMFLRGKAAAVESESIRILAKKCNIIRISNQKAFGQEIVIIFQKIFWDDYLGAIARATNVKSIKSKRVYPSRVRLVGERIRRNFYEIISCSERVQPVVEVLHRIRVFIAIGIFHIGVLAPEFGVCWIGKFRTLRT